MRRRSIARANRRMNAGSSVTDAAITTSTARLAATAMPWRNDTPTRNRPSTPITTVPPAIRTLRPDVVTASWIAASRSRPAARAAR